jgi:hypothetical protein
MIESGRHTWAMPLFYDRSVGRLVVIALPVLVLVVAACGGAKKAETPTRAHTRVSPRNSACGKAGITAEPNREGSCIANGVTITVADRAHWLHAADYDARFLSLRTTTTLKQRSGGTLRAHGKFVIVKLSIKNKLPNPEFFDRRSNLVFLLADKKRFSESHDAETDPALDPFALRGTALQPDEVATGTIVFDLPLEHAKNVFEQGSDLIFVNFSDEGITAAALSPPSGRIGFIRLWK